MLLRIENLTVSFKSTAGTRMIVDHVHLEVGERQIVGLVGGSGSGKTTTGLAILRLLAPQLSLAAGKIFFKEQDLVQLSEQEMRRVRGGKIGMVFQEPLDAFNPVFTIGFQIEEVLAYHTLLTKEKRRRRVEELLDIVGIPDPFRLARYYPHQLSGGMRQRAMIAQALAAGPQLIIADEPTSNLDVTLQARVIELFSRLREQLGISLLLITHDLGVVEHLTDKVCVMTEGQIVERGDTAKVMSQPRHPYTQNLMTILRG